MIKIVFSAIFFSFTSIVLFFGGDRGNHDSLVAKRRDAVWAVFRGIVGLGGGWVMWLATGQPLWLAVLIFLPVSLYLVISGITDLVVLSTRDRELLRREKAKLWNDRLVMEGARDAKRNHDLMRKAGMTDEEIEGWASHRFDKLQRELEKSLPDPVPPPIPPAPRQRGIARQASGSIERSRRRHDPVAAPSSKTFFDCWRAAGSHLNSIGQAMGIEWHNVTLEPPVLEHLSFRLANQLFFVRVRDVDQHVEGPGSMEGLLAVADGCKGRACVMYMRWHSGEGWKPDRPGWALVDARSHDVVDPPALVTDERIELTDWEVQDFAVHVVRDALKKEGHRILSAQANPRVDPSIWFVENGQRAWVAVRAARFPELAAPVPHNWRQLSADCARKSRIGYFASVVVAGGEERPGLEPDIRILRGHPLFARFAGLTAPTDDDVSAAEEDFIGRGRLASRHRRSPPT